MLISFGYSSLNGRLSTLIVTVGSFVLASSEQTANESYTSCVMATDVYEVTQSMTEGESLVTDLSVKCSGPVLISDYASEKSALIPDSLASVFIRHIYPGSGRRI